MDQLCEPIEVNRRFIKMIEEVIQPQYNKQLKDIFSLLQKDIDETYKDYLNIKSIKKILKKDIIK